MQGGNGCSHTEFSAHQAHAADTARGGAQQGDHGVNAEQTTAPESHHDSCEHQSQCDQQGWLPQQLQLFQGRAGQSRSNHGADADFQDSPGSVWPGRGLQLTTHAHQSCAQQSAGQRSRRDAAEQGQQSHGGAGQQVEHQRGQRRHSLRCGQRSDLELPPSMCCHRSSNPLDP